MIRLRQFITGALTGLLLAILLLVLLIRFLPNLIVTDHAPYTADAIIILGGDTDGSRLRKGLQLHDEQTTARLILVSGGGSKAWHAIVKNHCPDCTLEGRGAVYLDGSIDTRTDAQLSLAYCWQNNLTSILVVTSPYHSRRAQFVFNDIADDLQERGQAPGGTSFLVTVISSGDYGALLPPEESWWRDRKTLETVWLEFGKILYWELTPYLEFEEI